ncbi:hypothetical protein SDC9_95069 [bioreactor metagenome]|uniref:TRAP C4-dicarboxylate transport system permease DctM subunit domain-containing protein n=1 Tax=bioreactor metagenome TaxID=1076179 RepID=A0A645A577_9ZZZZ
MGLFIKDFAMSLAGRTIGGEAKVSIVASGLMGMINGSAVGNVAATGTFTIPLMRDAGFKPVFAAAVVAVAGTGGMIMPPVMGAASFIMAEYLGVQYVTIMLAAAIPAACPVTMAGGMTRTTSHKYPSAAIFLPAAIRLSKLPSYMQR